MSKTTTLADIVSANGTLIVPTGTTAGRPSATAGSIRFNTDLNTLESANGSAWANVGSGAASSGGGVSWQPVKNTNFIAVASNGYAVNTASGNVTVTLPANPSTGDQIQFLDYSQTFASNNFIINPNGKPLVGNTSNTIVNSNGFSATIVYIDSVKGWMPVSGFTSPILGPYTLSYLVSAGGGGGGAGVS